MFLIKQYVVHSGNESCPQPQTSEHLAAIEIMKLKHILILQNKIDLVKEGQAKEQHEQIVKFVQGTVAEGAPIIPISAQLKYNIEVRTKHNIVNLSARQISHFCTIIIGSNKSKYQKTLTVSLIILAYILANCDCDFRCYVSISQRRSRYR